MRILNIKSTLVVLSVLGASMASAEPGSYSFSVTGSGQFMGSSFTDSMVTFQFFGQTESIRDNGPMHWLGMVGEVGVQNGPFVSITDDLQAWNRTGSIGLMSMRTQTNILQIDSDQILDSALRVSTDGAVGTATIPSDFTLQTSQGALTLTSLFPDRGFFASRVATPEPTTIAALGLGMIGLIRGRAKRSSAMPGATPLSDR